jgi:hypothetical protein
MYSPLKPSSDGCVQLPGNVRRSENENTFRVLSNTVHLDEKFGLDTPTRFALAFASRSTESVYFVDEDNGGFVFAGQVEELFDQSDR